MNKSFILALLQMPKVGRKTVQKIYHKYKNVSIDENIYKEILEFIVKNNKAQTNLNDNAIHNYIENAENIIKESKSQNIQTISIFDKDYPSKLRDISDPPVVIFVKGNKDCLYMNDSVAIIGTRKPTIQGEKVAIKLGEIAANRGNVVISGLALGCDSFAHFGCVKNNGKSIAVLPAGLDKIYPSSNKALAQNILDNNGCLVSEYPIRTVPFANNYVERDRIQSGLSSSVIVVETDIKGGTMHTVNFALSQKKILACYAHDSEYHGYSQSQGNLKLINSNLALPLKNEDDINSLFKLIQSQTIATHKSVEKSTKYQKSIQVTLSDIGVFDGNNI
ncbi:DNA-processing protein DprA [Sedimentibacter sp. LTW-03]|uniref:DNA-processing protein DprA n=1 Tax=Sedimentibacter sp. LTW-03 TaxID=3453406 RepID=UPI003F850644